MSVQASMRKPMFWSYVRLARLDHWIKNAFMLPGTMIALSYYPAAWTWFGLRRFGLGVLATCLIASSNYVLNELLDARTDRFHPAKRHRVAATGQVSFTIGLLEWLGVGAAGLGVAVSLGPAFAWSGAGLWVMGLLYNVPPVRLKEWPHLDVLSESVNNPLRLMLGWFALVPDRFPSVSLLIAYWMAGAFLMATKRLAELRTLESPDVASRYRLSFRYYTPDRLLLSLFFYAMCAAFFCALFVYRYRLELVLLFPALAGMFVYYLRIGLRPNSATQHPEKLHREHGLVLYVLIVAALFTALIFVDIPALYRWLAVEPLSFDPLWTLDGF